MALLNGTTKEIPTRLWMSVGLLRVDTTISVLLAQSTSSSGTLTIRNAKKVFLAAKENKPHLLVLLLMTKATSTLVVAILRSTNGLIECAKVHIKHTKEDSSVLSDGLTANFSQVAKTVTLLSVIHQT